jgi:hypothetical protein
MFQHRRAATIVGLTMLACLPAVGCVLTADPGPARCIPAGYVYYLDGAGGGSAIQNWSGGVRKGLLAAGYNVFGEMFGWETGLGPLVDQQAGVDYKRSKAKELARHIQGKTGLTPISAPAFPPHHATMLSFRKEAKSLAYPTTSAPRVSLHVTLRAPR